MSRLLGRGAAVAATLALVLGMLLAPACASAAPGNDDFGNPRLLEGDELETNGVNFGATKEPGEPAHAGDPGGASVWFVWTAPKAERVEIDSCSYDSWEDVVAVYRGASLPDLELVGSSNSQPQGSCREVEFLADSATTYRIAVDGYSDGGAISAEEGEFSLRLWGRTLRVPATPPNDAFAAASDLGSPERAYFAESTEGASREAGEPGHPNDPEGASVWYRWTAPRDMRTELFPCQAHFHPVVSVFAGTAIGATTPVGTPAAPLQPSLPCMLGGLQGTAFDAAAGTTYSISVDGANGEWGRFEIALQPVPAPFVDTIPPATFIRKLRVRHRRVKILFESSEPGATFLCRLDKKPFEPCVSPRGYGHLSPGGPSLPGQSSRRSRQHRQLAGAGQLQGEETVKRLVALAVVVVALATPTTSPAALYWGHDDSIGVANLDLTPTIPSIREGLRARSTGLAVDSSHIYWGNASNDGTIGRANLDGSNADEAFISGLEFPSGLAADGSHLYWADRVTNLIGRANLDGSGLQRGFIGGARYPCGVAVDGGHVYWSNLDGGTIGRANLDGSQVEQDFITGVVRPCGVAVTSTEIYWTSLEDESEPGSIGRAPIGGGPAENDFISGVPEAFSLAANSTHLFWADEGWENFQGGGDPSAVLPGAIGRASLDGIEVDRRWLPTGLAHGVAVDSRVLPPPPPSPLLPAWYLRYGPLTRERSGALRLVVFVPGPGSFHVDSPAIGWQIEKPLAGPGTGFARWTLRLWPGKRTGAAKKIHRRLRRTGRAPFILHLTYQQDRHEPLESSKRLAFLRPRR